MQDAYIYIKLVRFFIEYFHIFLSLQNLEYIKFTLNIKAIDSLTCMINLSDKHVSYYIPTELIFSIAV